ncbi:hypothetical protein BDZ97DRAFT_835814 [Flammula alnicola]|nr:hypothetical protein BDZ97DRAFT_835814 [Flammula alnicola]
MCVYRLAECIINADSKIALTVQYLEETSPGTSSLEGQAALPMLSDDPAAESLLAQAQTITKTVDGILAGESPTGNTETSSSLRSAGNQSLVSSSAFPRPRVIQSADLKNHLPKDTERYIKRYMGTNLFDSSRTIPFWDPSPRFGRVETWAKHVYIGDVGLFDSNGGFNTLFNIFQTKAQNIARGYNPPEDFEPYHKLLPDLRVEITREMPPKKWKLHGFENDKSNTRPPDQVVIRFPEQINATECSAIHMAHGYVKIDINQWEEPGVLEYMRGQQEAWQRHLDKTSATYFHDRPFVIIFTSYRTESWALAAATKTLLSSKTLTVTLRELVHGNRKRYFWESDDHPIRSRFGPSDDHMDNIESYFNEMDTGAKPQCDDKDRRATRECHCVAVRAYSLQKKRWLKGGSVMSSTSSRSTVRANASRLSMPTRFTPSLSEGAAC